MPAGIGAELTHDLERALDYPADRAAPAGMDCGDDAVVGVAQDDRRAVRGQNTQHQAGALGDEGVALGTLCGGIGLVGGDRLGGVDLPGRGQLLI
jgi:hypothetical protein